MGADERTVLLGPRTGLHQQRFFGDLAMTDCSVAVILSASAFRYGPTHRGSSMFCSFTGLFMSYPRFAMNL